MKKEDKFTGLSKAKETIEKAPLKENDKPKMINISIKNFPQELKDAVDRSDETLSAFMRRATRKLAKEEGLI